MSDFDQRELRNAMGNFCTGVVVVTGVSEGHPAGFAAQSFVSLSLDPALIAFCPGKSSSSWPKLRDAGSFCVNILSAQHKEVCDAMAQSGGDKFANIDWRTGVTGAPILEDVIAYVDCDLEMEHDAGDHTIAVGRVRDFGVLVEQAEPLLFYRGAYGSFAPLA
ncbi:MAG: flavin reductase family protein [Pseudomonadota bacterium]